MIRSGGVGSNQYKKTVGVQNEPIAKTYNVIAKECNVSPSTVKRAEQYAESIDRIAETQGEEVKEKILSGELKTNKQDVVKLAQLEPKKQKLVFEGVTSGEYKDVKKAISGIETPRI